MYSGVFFNRKFVKSTNFYEGVQNRFPHLGSGSFKKHLWVWESGLKVESTNALPEVQGQFPQLSAAPGLENPLTSTGTVHMWCTDIHEGNTRIHILK